MLIDVNCFAMVLVDRPTISTAICLLLMIWAFSRAYYFAFYVIEKYIDPGYKRKLLLVIGGILVMTANIVNAGEWELVWSDEFDYQGLPDKTKWDWGRE